MANKLNFRQSLTRVRLTYGYYRRYGRCWPRQRLSYPRNIPYLSVVGRYEYVYKFNKHLGSKKILVRTYYTQLPLAMFVIRARYVPLHNEERHKRFVPGYSCECDRIRKVIIIAVHTLLAQPLLFDAYVRSA